MADGWPPAIWVPPTATHPTQAHATPAPAPARELSLKEAAQVVLEGLTAKPAPPPFVEVLVASPDEDGRPITSDRMEAAVRWKRKEEPGALPGLRAQIKGFFPGCVLFVVEGLG